MVSEQPRRNLVLSHIKVTKFRGQKEEINLPLDRQVSFVIGRNGTGKTTLINLISNCLTCRYSMLVDSPFESVKLTFSGDDRRNKPSIEINKLVDQFDVYIGMTYTFRDFQSRSEERVYRFTDTASREKSSVPNVVVRRRIQDEIERMYNVSWLALNRSDGLAKPKGESGNDLDNKLANSIRNFALHISRLDDEFGEHLRIFQQEWFLHLVAGAATNSMPQISSDININEEDRHIRAMLKEIGVEEEKYTPLVDQHISAMKRISDPKTFQMELDKKPIEVLRLATDIAKMHFLVNKWRALQEKKQEIYHTKEEFTSIADRMLYRKRLHIETGNQIVIRRGSDEDFDFFEAHGESWPELFKPEEIKPSDLSSGEKHLIIFLIETALNADNTYIFLADEPELSLHVEWQEMLVPAILELSPKVQILFATHSPDVVNKYRANIFSMEDAWR